MDTTGRYDRLARHYKWVTWFGIFLNSLFIFPLLLFPRFTLDLLGIELDQLIFARTAGLLLLWISVFYIPASLDLKKYRVHAWLGLPLAHRRRDVLLRGRVCVRLSARLPADCVRRSLHTPLAAGDPSQNPGGRAFAFRLACGKNLESEAALDASRLGGGRSGSGGRYRMVQAAARGGSAFRIYGGVFQVRLDRRRAGAGDPLLDLDRAAAPVSRASAGTRRLQRSRCIQRTRPRHAGGFFNQDHRLPESGYQLRPLSLGHDQVVR